jgi:hypothetical protein
MQLFRFLPAILFLLLPVMLIVSSIAYAQAPDLDNARRLVDGGKYQEAYDLLSPFESSTSNDATFTYLLGRAALGAGQADKAQTLFERTLEAQPGSVAAHLALGRAYFAQGQYALAKIEFETVLRFDNLPGDLLTQVEIYDRLAKQYVEDDSPFVAFGYLIGGAGYYRDNTPPVEDPDLDDEDEDEDGRRDPFVNARLGGAVEYILPNSYALDADVDYRFRHYDNPDTRNDSDWRWRFAVTRTVGELNWALGLRGRVFYIGDNEYRRDLGVFGDLRYRLDPANQLSFGVHVRNRRYPEGERRNRSRNIGDGVVTWTHSFADGKVSLDLSGNAGYEWATHRPDGNATIYGATGRLNWAFTDRLDAFASFNWDHNRYNEDRTDFDPDLDVDAAFTRAEDVDDINVGLVWEFARAWSLRPEFIHDRVRSNIPINRYRSIQLLVNLRKDF